MNEETQMTDRESMQLITSMINKAKNRVNETGTMYLLWGWFILGCCIVHFVGIYFFNNSKIYYIWYTTWLLLLYQFFYLRKRKKDRKVRTYTEEINGFVWIAYFICTVLLIFIAIQFKKYELINPMILVLYGMPTFLSGIILKFKPLVIGGAICWLLALVSPFININYHVLLIAAAIISGWIIPGYLLKRKFKKEN